MTPRRRRLVVVAVLAVLAAAAWGHWLYWYQPRLRAGGPGDDAPSRLLRDARFRDAAWVAHPHQTLPALGRRTGLDRGSVEALGRLLGADLRGLGGVRRLPARSLAVAATDDAEWAGAARVHPLAAGFLRLSGLLADNPLLAGGTLDLGESGRATVRWRRTEWSIRSARAPRPSETGGAGAGGKSPASAVPTAPALAWIRLARRSDPGLPHGLVSLSSSGRALILAGGGPAPPTAELDRGRRILERSGALLVLRRAAPRKAAPRKAAPRMAAPRMAAPRMAAPRRRGEPGDEILLLFGHPPGTPPSELPRSALLHRGSGDRRSDLPGESLLEIAGVELARGSEGGWRATATDAGALAGALAGAPTGGRVPPDGDGPRWALAVDLGPAAGEIGRLARGLQDSPLLPLRERRRWQDAARVLAAVGAQPGRFDGVVTSDGRVLLRLEHDE